MNTSTTDEAVAAFCGYCGQANPELSSTCRGCGTLLTDTPLRNSGTKSRTLALLFALVFGPLGLLYVSAYAGVVMFLIAVLLHFANHTIQGTLVLELGLRFACIVWAYVALRDQDPKARIRDEARRRMEAAAVLESSDPDKAIEAYEEVLRSFPDIPESREAERNIRTLRDVTNDE